MKSVYKHHSRASDLVPEELFNGVVETLNSAVSDDFSAEYPDLCEVIRHNNEVFSAFKVHDECSRMAKLLLDENGNLKSFERWSRDAEPIASHHNKVWLRTEYDQAIRRAEQARDWKQFEAEADVLPNLRWVPSTAAHPGADHMPFWNTVLPIDHPFWNEHKPGDRWGCQCSLEATDDPVTDVPAGTVGDEPAPGLDGNPAKTGHLFSESHPYYPSSCSKCPFYTGEPSSTPTNRAKDCGNCPYIRTCINDITGKGKARRNKELYRRLKEDKNYDHVKFDRTSGGMSASHKDHNFDKIGGKYELLAQNVGRRNGYAVILGKEGGGDIGERFTEGSWDGLLFEVAGRETATENNVFKGLKHCANKRTTQIAVLVYPNGGYDRGILETAIKRYKGLAAVGDGKQFVPFRKIICIQGDEIVYEQAL